MQAQARRIAKRSHVGGGRLLVGPAARCGKETIICDYAGLTPRLLRVKVNK
jgi:hypothetical protein